MRCSRCDMPLSPTGTSCSRCGTAVADKTKGQDNSPFVSVSAQSNYRQSSFFADSTSFVGTPVDIAPAQQYWGQNVQQTPFATTLVPPITPLAAPLLQESQTPPQIPDIQSFSSMPPLLTSRHRASGIGFGLAGLCIGIACLLLLFVYIMAQSLPQFSSTTPTHLMGGASLVTQSTPAVNSSPTTVPTVSATPTYPGQQYVANAQTASAVNATTAQTIIPAATFRVGQKIYITFDVHPNGQKGAICLLWFINDTQFTSYPFAINTTYTTSAYSYAATGNVGAGYIEIYWENAPSCTDPNKILSDHIDFTVTA